MRGICIHGHFYQPPRENAWLEAVETQASAAPYHDWNRRIAEECYAPNAAARVLDEDGLIVALVNNYARMSFDFGPTLLSWLEAERPGVYRAILEADAESARRCGGHGGAMAQAFHHAILPLSHERDRRTEVLWGVEDFRRRFGRDPEGMWLPEAAVDTPGLEELAAAGIRFTVLPPSLARRWRHRDGDWTEAAAGHAVDVGRPYRVSLPSGRSIAVFFYAGELSRRVAFDGLLRDGSELARELVGAHGDGGEPGLVSIATDGETYGHHHRFGDMALAAALQELAGRQEVRLTNYAEYLARHPPEHEVELLEPGSWSCPHGVGRWSRDCGCSTGGEPGWDQAWRQPLRQALEWLRGELAGLYEARAGSLLADPWAARDDYVAVLLDRGEASREAFLRRHAAGHLEAEARVRAWKLLEMQRHALMMFTSCGWFFADVAGIETRQVLQYAGRAVQLARQLGGPDLEGPLLERLSRARSNRPEAGDAARVYRRTVGPALVELDAVAANWAIDRLVLDAVAEGDFYCYRVETLEESRAAAGRAEMSAGVARVTSTVTREVGSFAWGVLHVGDQQLQAGVRRLGEGWDRAAARRWADRVRAPWERGDLMEVRDALTEELGGLRWDLRNMFRDDRQAVLDALLEETHREIEAEYRRIWERHAPLMRYLAGLDVPLSGALAVAAGFVLEADMRRLLAAPAPDVEGVRRQLEEIRRWDLPVDEDSLVVQLERAADAAMGRAAAEPDDPGRLRELAALVTLARGVSRRFNPWRTQNRLVRLRDERLPAARERAAGGDEGAARWVAELAELGRLLSVRIPA